MSKNTCGDYVDPSKEYQKICGGYRKNKQQKKQQKGGTMQYPFEPQFNNYPIPNKVDFKLDDANNIVNPVDMFGCKLLDKNYYTTPSMKGGDCGCVGNSMKLGGSLKKQNKQQTSSRQKGAGYGYTMNCGEPITNRCEVDRYPTDTALAGGSMNSSSNRQNKYLLEISRQKQNKQRGGSAASDSLMEYFLDFQHRCRGSEIY